MAETVLMDFWTKLPRTPLPQQQSPVRFAVGNPRGHSSNSWRLWTQGQDIYIACRDNYREFKVSLHASGIWRLGFTEKAVTERPELVADGADRVWKKWVPDTSDVSKVTVAVQIPVLAEGLFLQPRDRATWPSSVVFVNPPEDPDMMTVVAVGVAQTH